MNKKEKKVIIILGVLIAIVLLTILVILIRDIIIIKTRSDDECCSCCTGDKQCFIAGCCYCHKTILIPTKNENNEQAEKEIPTEEPQKDQNEFIKTNGISYKINRGTQEIKLNGNLIKIKNDYGLFINDKLVSSDDYSDSIIIVDKYILLYSVGEASIRANTYIDEDGNYKIVNVKLDKADYVQYSDIELVNGTLYAEALFHCIDLECPENQHVKFVYENKELSVIKAN